MDIPSTLLHRKMYLASSTGEGLSHLSYDEPFPGELNLDHVAYGRFFGSQDFVFLDLACGPGPSFIFMGDSPLVSLYYIIKKFFYLQKHIGSYSVVENSNHDQISFDL